MRFIADFLEWKLSGMLGFSPQFRDNFINFISNIESSFFTATNHKTMIRAKINFPYPACTLRHSRRCTCARRSWCSSGCATQARRCWKCTFPTSSSTRTTPHSWSNGSPTSGESSLVDFFRGWEMAWAMIRQLIAVSFGFRRWLTKSASRVNTCDYVTYHCTPRATAETTKTISIGECSWLIFKWKSLWKISDMKANLINHFRREFH